MVRFSDMLGGSDDSQAPPPTSAPLPDPPAAVEAEEAEENPEPDEQPVDTQAAATPEEVLDRLTQYAAEHTGEPTTSAPPAPTSPAPTSTGDDLLPHGKRTKRRG